MKVLIGPNVMGLERGIPELKQAHPTIEFVHCADRGAVAAAIADADIYMGHLGREVFLAAKKLQWVQSPSSGVNYFLAMPELKDGPVILTGKAPGTAPRGQRRRERHGDDPRHHSRHRRQRPSAPTAQVGRLCSAEAA